MNNQQPVPCRCGRIPERNTHLKGYEYSFVCKCGGSEINFASWSDNPQKLFDNWESLIKRTSYKHHVQHLSNPDDVPAAINTGTYYDNCPLRRHVRAMGGHCSGGGGAC